MELLAKTGQWSVEGKTASKDTMVQGRTQDLELLRQLAKGREEAFVALYERYQGPVYRFALHMSGNPAIAEEVVQETFLMLVRGPKNYDAQKGELGGYLVGVARNIVRKHLQAVRMDIPIDDVPAVDEQAFLATNDDALEDLSHGERLEALRRAVLSLPEQYRETVVLCDLEELDYAAAATALGCSPGTVASRLHRARAMLKTKLSCLCVK